MEITKVCLVHSGGRKWNTIFYKNLGPIFATSTIFLAYILHRELWNLLKGPLIVLLVWTQNDEIFQPELFSVVPWDSPTTVAIVVPLCDRNGSALGSLLQKLWVNSKIKIQKTYSLFLCIRLNYFNFIFLKV